MSEREPLPKKTDAETEEKERLLFWLGEDYVKDQGGINKVYGNHQERKKQLTDPEYVTGQLASSIQDLKTAFDTHIDEHSPVSPDESYFELTIKANAFGRQTEIVEEAGKTDFPKGYQEARALAYAFADYQEAVERLGDSDLAKPQWQKVEQSGKSLQEIFKPKGGPPIKPRKV